MKENRLLAVVIDEEGTASTLWPLPDVVLVFLLLTYFASFSIVFIVDFEQVNISWVVALLTFIEAFGVV